MFNLMKNAPQIPSIFLLAALLVGGCAAPNSNQNQTLSPASVVGTITPSDDGHINIHLPNGETRQEFVENFNLYEDITRHQGRIMRVFLEHKMIEMPPDDRLERILAVTSYQLL
jgi:hypothetical protein